MNHLLITLALLATSSLLLTGCDNLNKAGKIPARPAPAETAPAETAETTAMETETAPTTTAAPAAVAKNLVNMQAAYKGEMTATAKYAAYAKKAAGEGFPQIALLYRAISAAETIHAGNHKAVLAESGASVPVITPKYTVKSTRESLQDDIKGEAYEAATMYSDFLETATVAGNDLAVISLTYAQKTEKRHEGMYQRALAALEKQALPTLPTAYFICPTCGNTYENTAPTRCGISLTEGGLFTKIDAL